MSASAKLGGVDYLCFKRKPPGWMELPPTHSVRSI